MQCCMIAGGLVGGGNKIEAADIYNVVVREVKLLKLIQ